LQLAGIVFRFKTENMVQPRDDEQSGKRRKKRKEKKKLVPKASNDSSRNRTGAPHIEKVLANGEQVHTTPQVGSLLQLAADCISQLVCTCVKSG
jgi:hypothetical protein